MAIDVVAGVAWIGMYFISIQTAFIDSTTQQCSSGPALNDNMVISLIFFLLCMTDPVSTDLVTVHMH